MLQMNNVNIAIGGVVFITGLLLCMTLPVAGAVDSGETASYQQTALSVGDQSTFPVEITDVNDPVEPDEELEVTAEVSNNGEHSWQYVELLEEHYRHAHEWVWLESGETKTVTLETEASNIDSDRITVDSDDDSDSQTVRVAGAEPAADEVIVEVDYRGASAAEIEDALTDLEAVFDDAPVEHSDGSQGIDLHIIMNDELPEEGSIGLDEVSPGGEIASEYRDYKSSGYHYMVVDLADKRGGGVASYGRGVTYGDEPNDAMVEVFMHELGHSFGIGYDKFHGVDSTEVPADEYESVMNYNFHGELAYNSGEPFDDWKFIKNGYVPTQGGGECDDTPAWCPSAS